MYAFVLNFLNSASHLIDFGRQRQGEVQEILESPSVEPVDERTSTEQHDPELDILEKEFGKLHEGMKIEIDLHRLLDLIPRDRRKADAYKGLRSKLSKLGVLFIITSGHPKNKEQ